MAKVITDYTSWQNEYQRKLVSADEAISHIKSGDVIYKPVGQEPQALYLALAARLHEIENVEILGFFFSSDFGWFDDEILKHYLKKPIYVGGVDRAALAKKWADFVPWWAMGSFKHWDEGRPGTRPIDATLIQVTPPNQSGYCCVGSANWDVTAAARRAKLTVAQVNPHVIQSFGDSWIHVSEIDWFVKHDAPLAANRLGVGEPTHVDKAIAEQVSILVNNGDSLQIGVGSSTGVLCSLGAFDNKEDLGYFSELTPPGVIDLVKKGVITSKHNRVKPGKVVAVSLGNTPQDWAFMNQNPVFEVHLPEFAMNPSVISQNDNVTAINMALSMDLVGQIAVSSIGDQVYSGTGGQLCFALGAWMSKGGRYICVIPSITSDGKRSRISNRFPEGQYVTIPQDLTDIVVTEYGTAYLMGKSHRERADALSSIAHPDFRGELRKAARNRFWP